MFGKRLPRQQGLLVPPNPFLQYQSGVQSLHTPRNLSQFTCHCYLKPAYSLVARYLVSAFLAPALYHITSGYLPARRRWMASVSASVVLFALTRTAISTLHRISSSDINLFAGYAIATQ